MKLNYLVVLASSLIPMVVGMIWYNAKVMGNVWLAESGMTKEKANSGNMFKVVGFSMLFNVFVAMALHVMVIHQMGIYSTLMNEVGLNEVGSPLYNYLQDFMAKYGNNFRTFKHGAFHGFVIAIMFVLPIVGTSALYEQKSWKYIFIHVGYWAISLTLMGGVICAFA
ncbi:MAG: DUF1761 domain-containing protein [Bacteroidia bacterium]|nr:DUF1761 domain-containing protein [Bacteroidia bacterium]